ncbi:MAG: phosphodiesterase [Bacteroides sp.]|nr:phosphodiesterase [Eubacterium sp.]MCM1419076.1 phosphodiesterase [Roseburia sp.]MCM1462938.1 phosphodiesterase [Bacteroides sp.]
MKLMFASDLHGSASACQKMLAAYRAEKAERLVLLGDLLYHGPRNDLPDGYAPKEVIRQLNAAKNELFCVRGNCDTEVDQMVLDFPILAESALILTDGITLYLSHGHHIDPASPPPLKDGDVLVGGHTHLFGADRIGGNHRLNDGSVALPKGGNPPTYLVYEERVFLWKTLEGEEVSRLRLDE